MTMADAIPGFNRDESPLTRLATRRGPTGEPFLSASEVIAGERLRVDYTRANLMPSVTQRWEATPRSSGGSGGPGDLSDSALDARRRVDLAMKAIGPELGGVVLDVCCFLKGLELIERERQWPVRSAKLLLKAGLAGLSRHYGLDASRDGHDRGRIRRWRSTDDKPKAAPG